MRRKVPATIHAVLWLLLSIILLIISRNYTIQFWGSYVFVLIGALLIFGIFKYYAHLTGNLLPLKLPLLIVGYCYWGITWFVAVWIGIVQAFPLKVFLLLEAVPLFVFGGIGIILYSYVKKASNDAVQSRSRDNDINEIHFRINSLIQKTYEWESITKSLHSLKDRALFSDIASSSYDMDLIWSLQQSIAEIEQEVDSLLSIRCADFSRLEELIHKTDNLLIQNDIISKSGKR